jgi:hypothetical protein
MWPISWSLKRVRSAFKRPTKHIPQHLTERDFQVCIRVAQERFVFQQDLS